MEQEFGQANDFSQEGIIASFKILNQYLEAKLKNEELFKTTGQFSPETATQSSCSVDGTDDGDSWQK